LSSKHSKMQREMLMRKRAGRPAQRAAAAQAAPGGGPAVFLHERAQRWVLWARAKRGVPTGDEVRDLVDSGDLSSYKDDRREAGQELAYQALEAPDRERAHYLALQALQFDPECTDARRVVADVEATSHIDRVGRLKKALLVEEQRHAAVIEEFAGRMSDAVELMPYLRARFDLACALWAGDRRKRAKEHFEILFSQDADDAVGVRYPLMMARLYHGDADGAGVLLDDPDTAQAELLVRWARVLQRLLAADGEAADALFAELNAGRETEADSLASDPPAEFAYPGFFRDDIHEYAALCLRMLHWAWHATPSAEEWLRAKVAATAESAAPDTLTGA